MPSVNLMVELDHKDILRSLAWSPPFCGPHSKLMERENIFSCHCFMNILGFCVNAFSFQLFWPGAHGRSEMFRKVLGNLRLKTIVVKILTDKSSNKTYIQKVSALLETILLSRQTLSMSRRIDLYFVLMQKRWALNWWKRHQTEEEDLTIRRHF